MPPHPFSFKRLIILIFLTLITYSPVLFNGFVGDDEVIFLKNDFYHSIGNIKVLFSKDYVTDLSQYHGSKDGRYHGTGEWSYRPVRTASYFLDAYLYKFNPFGYHLTNLLLHTGAVIFLYLALLYLLPSTAAAFLTALLFSLHPLHLEAVAGISYRTDTLAALFTFGAFCFYLKHERQPGEQIHGFRYLFLSLLFYILGILSKESVIIFPLIIFFHGLLVSKTGFGRAFARASGFILIAAIYLVLYFYVFKNSFIGNVPFSREPWMPRLITSGVILVHYLTWIVFPQQVHLLPGLFTPAAGSLTAIPYLPAGLCLAVAGILLWTDKERRATAVFFLLWFLTAYLPVSNIIALANPCAHRFMYFPSAGIFALLSMAIIRLTQSPKVAAVLPRLQNMIFFLLTGLLMIQTLPMAFFWKNNLSVATQWVKHYPGFFKGYEVLALEYFKQLDCERTLGYAGKAITLNPSVDPRMHYVKGSCLDLNHPDKEGQLLKAVDYQPNFMQAHFELGKLYFSRGDFTGALQSFETAYALAPQFNTSIYLIRTYLALGQRKTAERFYSDLYEESKDKRQKRYLDEFFLKSFSEFSPVP
ncbi:MAG: hypothetical protein AB7S78_13710 [Candidatus Omnitrophota bacterium]